MEWFRIIKILELNKLPYNTVVNIKILLKNSSFKLIADAIICIDRNMVFSVKNVNVISANFWFNSLFSATNTRVQFDSTYLNHKKSQGKIRENGRHIT